MSSQALCACCHTGAMMKGLTRRCRLASGVRVYTRCQSTAAEPKPYIDRNYIRRPPPPKPIRGDSGRGWYKLYEEEGPEGFIKYRPPTPFDWEASPDKHLRTKAFLDITIDKQPAGRIVIELADDVVPLTAKNFRLLCEGKRSESVPEDAPRFCYKGSTVQRIVKDSAVVMGYVAGDPAGIGNHSAFKSRFFPDEGFIIPHTEAGLVTTVSAGVHRNASMFYITTGKCAHLDGRAVGFGRVLQGMDIVQQITKLYMIKGRPVNPVTIEECGVLTT